MGHAYEVGDKVRLIANEWGLTGWNVGEVYEVASFSSHAEHPEHGPDVYLKGPTPGSVDVLFYNREIEPFVEEPAQCVPMQQTDEHVSPTGGRRANAGKLPVELVPASLILGVADVLKAGAAKYAPRNWEKGMELSIPYACAVRHLLAWLGGEDNDPETGKPHMAHVATNAAFVLEYQRRIAAGTLPASLDDRPKS